MNSLVIKTLACINQLTSRLNITLAKASTNIFLLQATEQGKVLQSAFRIDRASLIHPFIPSPIRRLFPQVKKADIVNQYCSALLPTK